MKYLPYIGGISAIPELGLVEAMNTLPYRPHTRPKLTNLARCDWFWSFLEVFTKMHTIHELQNQVESIVLSKGTVVPDNVFVPEWSDCVKRL